MVSTMTEEEQAAQATRHTRNNDSVDEELGLKDLPPNSFVRRYSYGNMGGMSKEYHPPTKQVVSLGHPEALGLAGFAATDFMLSCINAKLLPSGLTNSIIALGFMYGGSAQLIAGIMTFIKQNTFGGVAFSSYGAFWLAFGVLITLEAEYGTNLLSTTDFDMALGFILVCYTIFNTYMFVATMAHNIQLYIIFLTLEMQLVLVDMHFFGAISSVPGGILGMLCSISAWVLSATIVINDSFGTTVIPNPELKDLPIFRDWVKMIKGEK
ncbi:putative acetate transporter [Galdieria sulphuraria]|uniref:Putative acetate transporter n=1 Tax=Galdieria sulphuraria TaxID=130081 RepID=M2Y856_GALSU|nr:putative acetate transporter [Galdieria sulphuraria]EME32024.1 putative acetate transporter [Galdieria sulphuraria]|eukprot:XP_005708544.1 putative acetate transporter [Galdieria sulphuraria]